MFLACGAGEVAKFGKKKAPARSDTLKRGKGCQGFQAHRSAEGGGRERRSLGLLNGNSEGGERLPALHLGKGGGEKRFRK